MILKKTHFILALLLLTNSFFSLAESITFDDWKYVEVDGGHYAITESGSLYITYKNQKQKEKFSVVSNVPCNYVTALTVNSNKIEFLCKRNKWGKLSMTFPQKSDKYMFELFKRSNSVNFNFEFSDGSNDKVTLSALGFTKASNKGASKVLTIEEQKIAALKEAKSVCRKYKSNPAGYNGCMRVYLLNNYSHL